MKLSSRDHEAISQALKRIYTLTDLDGYVVAAMKELPALMDADMTAFNEVNYGERRMMVISNSRRLQRIYDRLQLSFQPIMHQNPLITHYKDARDGPKKISDFLTRKQWQSTDAYQMLYCHAHGEHQIAVVLPLESQALVAFAFNRRKSDFTERHRAILAILQPHLARAYENAKTYTRSRNRLKRREHMLEAIDAGWIDLDYELNIINATPLARANLAMFCGAEDDESRALPQSLMAWVSDAVNVAREGGMVPPHVVENEQGRLILRLLYSEASGEASLLTERFLDASSPKPLEELGLTRRQAEVLFWISQGKSNAEIAVLLNISVRTAVFHVSRIFEVLGVANRTEAANVAAGHLAARR